MQNTETIRDVEMTVIDAIYTLLRRRGDGDMAVTLDSVLGQDLDLDSLELAEFSIMLEESLGSDPYSDGTRPQTVGEVVAFYRP